MGGVPLTPRIDHGEESRRTHQERTRQALSRIEREVASLSRDCDDLELEHMLARLAAVRHCLVDTGALLLRNELITAVCHGGSEQHRDPLSILEDLRRLPGCPSRRTELSDGPRRPGATAGG